MHEYYLGGYKLDVRDRFVMSRSGNTKSLEMADGNELVIPNNMGLAEYNMHVWVDLEDVGGFLDFIDNYTQSKKPVEFVINRRMGGVIYHGTAVDVVIFANTNYVEDASTGTAMAVELTLKEYRIPETTYVIQKGRRKAKTVKVQEDIRNVPETVESSGEEGQNIPEIMTKEKGMSPTVEEVKKTNPSLWSLHGIATLTKGFFVNLFSRGNGGIR